MVRIRNEKERSEIIRNKHKLKGCKIFTENDLSWERRKIQERINKWNRKGEEKVGISKIKIDGIWKAWNVIEREDEEKKKNKIDKEGEKTEAKVRGKKQGG